MFGTVNSALELGRRIHKNGSAIFMFVTWTAAILAIVAVLQSSHPSDIVHEILSTFGAAAPADYFGLDAPSAIRFQSRYWQSEILRVTAMMITIISIYVLIGGSLSTRRLKIRGNMLAISPWPNLVWLLFFVAVQIGPAPLPVGSTITDWAYTAVNVFLGLLALTTLLALIGLNRWLSDLTSSLIGHLWTAIAHIVFSFIYVLFGLVLVVAWLPLEIWTVIDRRQHIRDDAIEIPSGAEPLDLN